MSSNPIVFWELASHNAEESVQFFKKAFGWGVEYDRETKIYYIPVTKEDNQFSGGGVFTLSRARLPFLTIYIAVDDIDEKAKEIEKLGAFIVEPPFNITPRSRICLFNEPSGVTFAMIQKRKTS